MTNVEFIDTIVNYYNISRKLSIDAEGYHIWRGVNHSISSQAEDLFALFVAKHINDKSLEFIVDKTMTVKIEGEKSITFRPDLAIVRDSKVLQIIDLKMDLGYKRRLHETTAFEKEKIKFEQLRKPIEKELYYTVYIEGQESKVYLDVCTNVTNKIVVISDNNGGKKANKEDLLNEIEKLDWVNIYYLSGDNHPNSGNQPTVYELEFERLLKDIKSQL